MNNTSYNILFPKHKLHAWRAVQRGDILYEISSQLIPGRGVYSMCTHTFSTEHDGIHVVATRTFNEWAASKEENPNTYTLHVTWGDSKIIKKHNEVEVNTAFAYRIFRKMMIKYNKTKAR